ncbi:2-oxoglutarate and iron-dependent oxygenase domain-containing protein [Pendulispora albinea]|uniref:2-oxoglutarate-dependent ethylene/succinate-forming enzyme n=1 Tax=Pendulispora albinea TaxID=2741071 RepID=A0ABZ2M3E0_9BACT
MNDIPLIDISGAKVKGSREEQEVARQLDQACREIGFFTLHGHGIPRSVFEDAFTGLHTFFKRPLADKLPCRLGGGGTLAADPYTPYGYSGLLEENAFAHMGLLGKPSDYVEKFSAGRLILSDETPLPFTDDDPGRDLRRKLKVYYRACEQLAARVTELFTLSLGLPRDYFAVRIDRSNDSMRGHYYPGFSGELANDQGMGEHCDSTLISLLTHTAPGIEVKTRDGKWITPQFREVDHFIVNIGDLMAHWTKNAYVSTPHRVVLHPEPRYSIAFFKLTNEDEMVQFGNKQMDALLQRDRPGVSP